MANFRFRLKEVLHYRRVLEREQGRELARKNFLLQEAEGQAQELLSEIDRSPAVAETVMRMADIALSGDYQQALREALIEQRLLVLEAAAAVDAAREMYVERAKDAEVLETLRERQYEKFKVEESRRERKRVDEVVVQRHRFTKPGSSEDENG